MTSAGRERGKIKPQAEGNGVQQPEKPEIRKGGEKGRKKK